MNGSIKKYIEYQICNLNNKFDKFSNSNFKGEIGPQGIKGTIGERGIKGNVGQKGEIGIGQKGSTGNTGYPFQIIYHGDLTDDIISNVENNYYPYDNDIENLRY